tara:strand:+ start:240 stop:776 length:537 start_codon:yes stop_codon:yes gene_type:complete
MRFLDILFSLLGILIFLPLFFFISVVGYFDTGSPLFFQKRVGLNLKSFMLVKFRTMKTNTTSRGTHLVDPSNITSFGYFLRKYKIDELPQLWNVFNGSMSLVGPRPCLFNQKKLISERKKRGVFKVKPGITGLAQISRINMKTPTILAKTDLKMIKKINLYYYFYYILKTLLFSKNLT